jgi:RNA polymerase sigma factor (sigma-70 family)
MNGSSIIETIRNGDKRPLAEVYSAFRSEFMNWISAHYTCTREEAQDIYQASIITLYENIHSEKLLHLNGTIKTYLFAIGKNKAMELRRHEKKINTHSDVEEIELEDIKDWEKDKRERDLVLVERSLKKLGEPCKTMLELYYLHGMGLEELAKHLNYRNANTIKNLKCRCLAKLRELMVEESKQVDINDN